MSTSTSSLLPSRPHARDRELPEVHAVTTPHGPAELWTEFHDRLLTFIRRRISSETDADDILQEVFLRIHRSAEHLPEVENVSGWVYRITRNTIIDHHRARSSTEGTTAQAARERLRGDATPTESPGEDGPSEAGVDLARCVQVLVNRLPAPYARAVAMTELEGATQKEAAERLGISVSGMNSRVQRGRGKLKDLLVACCTWELDGRGGVLDVEPRGNVDCGPACACGGEDPVPAE